uniref:Uncharacterized protein n=1 Tax=Arundo donax TaxID=35708 RepID=A0A0A9H452_ARUDO
MRKVHANLPSNAHECGMHLVHIVCVMLGNSLYFGTQMKLPLLCGRGRKMIICTHLEFASGNTPQWG